MSIFQKILTFLNRHSPTSTSPVGLIFLLYCLFFLGISILTRLGSLSVHEFKG